MATAVDPEGRGLLLPASKFSIATLDVRREAVAFVVHEN